MSRFTDSLISQGYSREYAERVSDDRADRAYQEEKDRLSEEALRLLAAAPDLLIVAQQAIAAFNYLSIKATTEADREEFKRRENHARAAIAKAAP